ncbi:MAG: NUDIX hydrolase [Lachnospiraceae bacterium]|jgi:ADP-ribose pyrophosphatase|nr:NUDIX hydrolase [Lachnospiraceae bacterium]
MSDEVRRVNRTLIHKGAIIEYYVDTMEFPGGSQAKWDFIKHNGAAAAVPVTEDGKILMVRQYRNALERYTLEIPAGGLNPGENTDVAAARELEEETGYASDDLELLISLRTTVAFCNEKIDIYVAKNLVKTHQHLDEDEFLNVEAYSLKELEDKIFRQEIEDSKTIAALMAYKVKYGI